MRLDLFPLETETDTLLLARIAEEASEVAKAALKIQRFGLDAHPAAPAGTNNLRDMLAEFADIRLCMAEAERRWAAASPFQTEEAKDER